MSSVWKRLGSAFEARPWLVLVVAALIAIPTVVLGEVAASETRTRLRDAQMQAQAAAGVRAAKRASFVLGDVGSYLVDATRPSSALVSALTAHDATRLQAALMELAGKYTYTPSYFFVDTTGTIVAGANGSAVSGPEARVIGRRGDVLAWAATPHSRMGTRFMPADELARTFRSPELVLFDLYLPTDASGEPMVIGSGDAKPRPGEERQGYIGALGIRVIDGTGKLAGALVADINPAPFIDAIYELQGIAADAYLVDRNGRLVRQLQTYWDHDIARGLRSLSAADLDQLRTDAMRLTRSDPFTGAESVLTTARVPDKPGDQGADLTVGWTVVAAEPVAQLYADVDAEAGLLRAIRVALALGMMLFAGLLTFAIRRVVRQRADLATANVSLERAGRELADATRHKSEFLANMSHELRTPLNSIIGFADVLAQRFFGDLNAKQQEYIGDISTSGRHLLELVNEILDLSKVEAGRMELDRSDFDAAEMVRSTLTFVRERAATHAIQLSADIAVDLGAMNGDERKLRQVLLNLLSNAIKFTPAGGSVSLTAQRAAADLVIAVRDTGIGIAAEDVASVFEEFRQVGKRSDASREGTGLGLTLAKRFVELHGGRIWVDSTPGQGSTFTFAVPMAHTAAIPVSA